MAITIRLCLALLVQLLALQCSAITLDYENTIDTDLLVWSSGLDQPIWADKSAKQGGHLHLTTPSPVNHWRRFGPETPTVISETLSKLQIPLLARHPNTDALIPMLISEWAIDEAEQKITLRIDPSSRWSDGIPVTTSDVIYTLLFLTSGGHDTEYQRNYINQILKSITVHNPSEFTLHFYQWNNSVFDFLCDFRPLASHFYQSSDAWPYDFDWMIEPVTGPYEINSDPSPDEISFYRTPNWWGDKQKFLAYRFNPKQVTLTVQSAKTPAKFSIGSVDVINTTSDANWKSEWLRKLTLTKHINRLQFAHQGERPFAALVFNSSKYSTEQQSQIIARLPIAEALTFTSEMHALSNNLIAQEPAEPVDIDVLYTDPTDGSWLAELVLKSIKYNVRLHPIWVNQRELKFRLKTNDFDIALLKTSAKDDASTRFQSLLDLYQQPGPSWLIYDIPIKRYAYWQWLKLPATIGTRISSDIFDPFDPVTGGLFWIDRKLRADTLSQSDNEKIEERPPVIHDLHLSSDKEELNNKE